MPWWSGMYSWGSNSYGQLCLGHQEDKLTPQEVHCKPESIRSIIGGGGHTAVISDSGELFTSGWNNKGQLGIGDHVDKAQLRHIKTLPAVVSISCGWNHTMAITAVGKLFVWGSNAFGQLGIRNGVSQQSSPVICEELHDKEVVAVAAGLRHSLAVLGDGSVWSWGNNKRGQLGSDTVSSSGNVYVPTRVHLPDREKAVDAVAGSYHSAIRAKSGGIYCWGSNQHGQCGKLTAGVSGQTTSYDPAEGSMQKQFSTPQLIKGKLSETKIIYLRSGWSHLVAVCDRRQAFSWGRADYGQLGRGDEVTVCGYSSEPDKVQELSDVVQLACGAEHNVALTGPGKVLTWGWNEHGICGTGDETNRHVPTEVTGLQNVKAKVIGCGGGHSFIVTQTDNF